MLRSALNHLNIHRHRNLLIYHDEGLDGPVRPLAREIVGILFTVVSL